MVRTLSSAVCEPLEPVVCGIRLSRYDGDCQTVPDAMAFFPTFREGPADDPLPAEATVDLLALARRGDEAALDRLIRRCLPPLRRWAHGRLPPSSRPVHETADLVQEVVIAALRRLDSFEVRHQGALQAYLRQAVVNRIRDIIRQRDRRPEQVELPETIEDTGPSPLEQAIGAENVERYERGIARLEPSDREAIIGRIELQYSYSELAVLLNKPSPSAARMAVTRALKRLAKEMSHV